MAYCICDSNLQGAINYLKYYPPDVEKKTFEAKIRSLFDSQWMIELVDGTLLRVKEFPDYGYQYFELLSKSFLSRLKHSEMELLDVLGMERSRLYDRKKEAIMVFGVVLWGTEVPELERFLTVFHLEIFASRRYHKNTKKE